MFPNNVFFIFFKSFPIGLTHSTDTANSLINSLLQVNCVVLTHQVVYGRSDRKRVALVDVLDCLLSANFVLVGMKMAMLSHEQVSELLTLIGSKSHKKQVGFFMATYM